VLVLVGDHLVIVRIAVLRIKHEFEGYSTAQRPFGEDQRNCSVVPGEDRHKTTRTLPHRVIVPALSAQIVGG
jgi:hypothetical protein